MMKAKEAQIHNPEKEPSAKESTNQLHAAGDLDILCREKIEFVRALPYSHYLKEN
jgi:hypothetical protein